MKWVEQFQLFLFDLDGLLVNTEPLHYLSYKEMCQRRGMDWRWDFEQYCKKAHGEAQGIKQALLNAFPELFKQAEWDLLIRERKEIYTKLLDIYPVGLMSGVEPLLHELQRRRLAHCVVTNSSREHAEKIKRFHSCLQAIPHWVTREDYACPKPAPDGYIKAWQQHGSPQDGVIGFEDTHKGFKALKGIPARAVLICPSHLDHVPTCKALGGEHFVSFAAMLGAAFTSG